MPRLRDDSGDALLPAALQTLMNQVGNEEYAKLRAQNPAALGFFQAGYLAGFDAALGGAVPESVRAQIFEILSNMRRS